jgi:redox-sensitive bicupin YhaK (pirin superfamily)
MTAGRGITHSERTAQASRKHSNRLFGIQSWVALPRAHEESSPAFVHYGASRLPVIEDGGALLRLIAGTGWGLAAPVATPSELFYADASLQPGAAIPMPDDHEERAAFVVEGDVDVSGVKFEAGQMLLFRSKDQISLRAGVKGARLLLLGGAVMDGPRHLFWNFVSSSRERIEQAKADWKAGLFGVVPGDDKEFIPLPEVQVAATAQAQVPAAGSPTS